jgi:hypothetical protein
VGSDWFRENIMLASRVSVGVNGLKGWKEVVLSGRWVGGTLGNMDPEHEAAARCGKVERKGKTNKKKSKRKTLRK